MKEIKRNFNRLGRHGGSFKRSIATSAPADGSCESTPLLGLPYIQPHDDEPRWKFLSKRFLRITWTVLIHNYINILLVFVPIGIVGGGLGWNPTAVFVINFIAIIPLAALLSFATEELSDTMGQKLGGFINATFGNVVELIVSIIALKRGEIRIVQSSMLGSILSNILLVLGCCFLAGGIREQESSFNKTVASTMSSLMAVASASLIIPATLYAVIKDGKGGSKDLDADENILLLSHGTAIILFFLYILYLYFQIYSHHSLFTDIESQEGGDEESAEGQTLSPFAAGFALVFVTVLVAVCAEHLVGSIDSIVKSTHVSKTFVGLILIPIVGNASEHVTAIFVAYKGKMNLAISVAIGSSMQIALFVIPFLVILGWIMDQPMTLHFQSFETIIFFISVLIVNYIIQDGKSNYLEGAMCLGTYIVIALALYVYPENLDGNATPSALERFLVILTQKSQKL